MRYETGNYICTKNCAIRTRQSPPNPHNSLTNISQRELHTHIIVCIIIIDGGYAFVLILFVLMLHFLYLVEKAVCDRITIENTSKITSNHIYFCNRRFLKTKTSRYLIVLRFMFIFAVYFALKTEIFF